jgi:hypothetical protein
VESIHLLALLSLILSVMRALRQTIVEARVSSHAASLGARREVGDGVMRKRKSEFQKLRVLRVFPILRTPHSP